MRSILIVDYGGPSVHKIKEAVKVSSRIILPEMDISPHDCLGVILSGGPDHVYNYNSRKLPNWLPSLDVPVLGICYGMQLIVKYLGGKVIPAPKPERGLTQINRIRIDPLLTHSDLVWMNHDDIVSEVPNNLMVTSLTSNGYINSLNDNHRWWGVQFHPESSHYADDFFLKFLKICQDYKD